MPGLYRHPISRQDFLRQVAVVAGAAIIPTRLQADDESADAARQKPLRLALTSDTHIPADPNETYRDFAPVANLQQIIPQIVAADVSAMLINGDAARLDGQQGDYERLKETLRPVADQMPVFIGLGNHDDRGKFSTVFSSVTEPSAAESPNDGACVQATVAAEVADVTDKHVLVIEDPVVRIVLLDSLLYVNHVAGLLGQAQRQWLRQQLQHGDDKPTVLFLHHTLGDGDGDLLDTDRLFRLLRPHRQVKAIFFGHSHQYSYAQRNQIHLINLPAVGYNFNDREPVGWVLAEFRAGEVDLTLQAIAGNTEQHGQTKTLKWER